MASNIASLTGGAPRLFFPLIQQKDRASTVAQAVFRSEAEAQEFIATADLSKFKIPLTYKRFKEAAVVFTALGIFAAVASIFAPPVIILAVCLFLLAIGCEIASRDQKERLDLSLGEQVLLYQRQKALLQNKQLSSRVDRLAFVEEYLDRKESKLQEGEYTKENLVSYVHENSHFSIGAEGYAYRVQDIAEKQEPYTQTLYRSYVQQFLGSDRAKPEETALERFKDCIEGNQGKFLEKRALQLSAFLKLLGDHNCALPQDINDHLVTRHLEMDVDPSVHGRLDVMFSQEGLGSQKIIFQIRGEQFSLYATENREAPLGVFQTSRMFEISPPDQNGNVNCSISASYICLG
jgi:hypothetical protein